MFKCQFSGKQVSQKIKPVTIVLEKKSVEYVNYVQKDEKKEQVFSSGWEIVKEIKVSPDEVANCVKHYNL